MCIDKVKQDWLALNRPVKGSKSLEKIIPGINLRGLRKEGLFYQANEDDISGYQDMSNNFSWMIDGGLKTFPYKPFENQVVVDLGSGRGNGYAIAASQGAKAYVAVDTNWPDGAQNQIHMHQEKGGPIIPSCIVQDDMRSFVKRLPESSASFLVAGIDVFVVGPVFFDRMQSDLLRALHPKGAIAVVDSDDLSYNLRQLTYTPFLHPFQDNGVYTVPDK